MLINGVMFSYIYCRWGYDWQDLVRKMIAKRLDTHEFKTSKRGKTQLGERTFGPIRLGYKVTPPSLLESVVRYAVDARRVVGQWDILGSVREAICTVGFAAEDAYSIRVRDGRGQG